MKKRFIPALILASTFSLTATAAEDPGWFIGAAAGQSDVDVSGYDEASSYKILAGYDFNRNWALGIEYADLGDFDISGLPASVEIDGYNLFGMYSHPINDSFSLFAKAGFYLWDAKAKAVGSTILTGDDSDFSWGFGGSLNVTDSAALTLEYQRFDIAGDDVDTITGGITFHF